MAASTFVNLVRVYSNSAGTGPLVLGLAEPGFRGTDALTDGATYSYTFQIGVDNRTPGAAAYETGRGVWDASTSTLTRSVVESSLAGQPVGVLMNTPIAITVLAQDFAATDQAALAAAVLDAQGSADDAATSAASIVGDVALADAAATAASGSATNAANSATLAGTKADAASASATTAGNAATTANNAATNANGSAIAAAASATNAAGSVAAVGASATAAANSATAAAGSATSAGLSASSADSYSIAAGASATAAHNDRLAADADAAATAADRAVVHTDRLAADADAIATAADRTATHADRLAADADAVATAADRVQTGLDRTSTTASAASAGTAATTASTAATTATTQAGIATTQAGIATTQAGNAGTSATAAAGSATAASGSATAAALSATSAGNSATTATSAATNATTAATNAASSATTANTAAASTSGAVAAVAASASIATTAASTATTQAGIATAAVTSPSFAIQFNPATPTVPPSGVASGSTYWAVDATSVNLVLYTNTAGTGVAVSPSVKLSLFQLLLSYPGATEFALLDPNGFPWFAVTPTAMRHQFIDALTARTAALEAFATHFPNIAVAGYPEFSLTDPNGFPWFRATPTILQHPTIDQQNRNINAALRGPADPTIADMRIIAERIGLHMSGESLSLGHASSPLYSTAPSPYSDMFGNAGLTATTIVPDDISNYITGVNDPNLIANRAALTTAFETNKNPGSPDWTSHGETPLSGCAQMIVQLLKDEDGIDFTASGMKFLLADDGRNGGSIVTEDENTTGLTAQRVYASFGQAQALYGALGKSYAPAAQMLITGTNDNASDGINYPGGADTKWFYTRAQTVQAQRQAKARALGLIGPAARLPLLIGQTATHTYVSYFAPIPHVALDQVQLAIDHPEFILACIQYAVQNGVNDVHMTGAGSKQMGAYFGWHLKRLMFDGLRIGPMVPTFTAQGSKIVATFPIRPGHKIMGGLTVVDTTVLSNWGVAAVDSIGTPQALTNPRVVARDRIVWDAPAAPTNTWKFRCAYTGNSTKGWTNIAEGRADSTLIFDPGYLRLPMYRWLPICEVPLT